MIYLKINYLLIYTYNLACTKHRERLLEITIVVISSRKNQNILKIKHAIIVKIYLKNILKEKFREQTCVFRINL